MNSNAARIAARTLFIVLGLALSSVVWSAQPAPWSLETIFRSLADNPPEKARFYEQREISELDDAIESTGELEFRAPAVLIKRTLSPDPEILTLDGDKLIVEQEDFRREMLITDMPGIGAFAASLRGFVGGRRAEVEAAFKLMLSGAQDNWVIKGTPNDSAVGKVVASIRVTGSEHRLQVIEVKLANGDSSTLTLIK